MPGSQGSIPPNLVRWRRRTNTGLYGRDVPVMCCCLQIPTCKTQYSKKKPPGTWSKPLPSKAACLIPQMYNPVPPTFPESEEFPEARILFHFCDFLRPPLCYLYRLNGNLFLIHFWNVIGFFWVFQVFSIGFSKFQCQPPIGLQAAKEPAGLISRYQRVKCSGRR